MLARSPWTRLPVFLMGVLAGIQQLRRASPGFQVRAHRNYGRSWKFRFNPWASWFQVEIVWKSWLKYKPRLGFEKAQWKLVRMVQNESLLKNRTIQTKMVWAVSMDKPYRWGNHEETIIWSGPGEWIVLRRVAGVLCVHYIEQKNCTARFAMWEITRVLSQSGWKSYKRVSSYKIKELLPLSTCFSQW